MQVVELLFSVAVSWFNLIYIWHKRVYWKFFRYPNGLKSAGLSRTVTI